MNRNLWLLVAATVVAGYYNANAPLYRFSAAELAPPAFREKAVSLVMAGGLIGAVLGPNLAVRTRNLTDVPFAGAYLALAGVALLAMGLLAFIEFARPMPHNTLHGGRPKRFGTLPTMAVGLALNVVCVAIALSGVDFMQFLAALFLLGLGWNFLFTGSTTLALTAYRPEEKDKAQGALNFCVFAILAVSSLASGVLVTTQGWALLNLVSLLPLGLIGLALVWLGFKQRQSPQAA